MMRAMLRRAVTLVDPTIVIHEAGHGADALQLLEAHAVDVVFTDINMPVLSGMELLREIQARGWKHIQSVIISTDGTDVRHAEAMGLGVRLYLTKPFAPGALQDVLQQLEAPRHD
jgi:two-component system chemotaxis response regulator CheY